MPDQGRHGPGAHDRPGFFSEGTVGHGLNILAVEDSSDVRILTRVLRQTEVAIGVFEAWDGLETLEVVRSHLLPLVLSDTNMPDEDFLSLPARLKAWERRRDVRQS